MAAFVSNTPLQWVIESNPRRQDTLAFQVDLWSSQGALPRNLAEVTTWPRRKLTFSPHEQAPANLRTCTGSSAPLMPC